MDLKVYLAWGIVAPVSCFFSFLLMIATKIVLYNEDHTSKKKLMSNVLWMSFADLGFSFSTWMLFFYSQSQSYVSCRWLGIIIYFFALATRSWYFVNSIDIFLQIHTNAMNKCTVNQYISHLYVWGSSCIIAVLPFHNYTRFSTGICFIGVDTWYFLLPEYILTGIYIFFAMLLLISIVCILNQKVNKGNYNGILFRTHVFVFVFIITWLPPMIFHLINRFDWADGILFIFLSANGTFNFIVWFFSFPRLRKGVIRFIRRRKYSKLPGFGPLLSDDERSTEDFRSLQEGGLISTSFTGINSIENTPRRY